MHPLKYTQITVQILRGFFFLLFSCETTAWTANAAYKKLLNLALLHRFISHPGQRVVVEVVAVVTVVIVVLGVKL